MAPLKTLFASLAGASLLGAAPAPAPQPVVAVATDFHLALPATLPAGPTTFELENRGREPHQLYLVHLEQGKTEADLVRAFQAGGPLPAWAVDAGGPNAVDPGATSTPATVELVPGSYAALCVIPSPDGTPHVMKGMITMLTVTPRRTAAAEPSADLTVKLVDYGYDLSAPLTRGAHEIRVVNDGKQSHELVLLRLHPGKSMQDLAAWAEKMSGPPPASFLGGVSPLSPGGHNEFAVELTPGRYALLCFLPDANDGKPHTLHGMAREIDVK
jgi:hypothetical protein